MMASGLDFYAVLETPGRLLLDGIKGVAGLRFYPGSYAEWLWEWFLVFVAWAGIMGTLT